ncbi:MAG: hypothetical protein JW863_08290 [Chitinispirillaceae bacterium]|nr:hypothetical protein [Chitinispirillaceae bacterium]
MDFKGPVFSSRPFIVTFLVVLALVVIGVLAGTILVARNTYLSMRLSSLCPDYFSYEYAWIVDENGKGMDSVAVTMSDNSNVNLIYRTFTDSIGRFVLFHDFGSFALYKMPFSYFLYVSANGWSDTVCYTFERYRVCHFRKVAGPDTIVFNAAARSSGSLRVEHAVRVRGDSCFTFAPYERCALSRHRPTWLRETLPYDTVFYGSLRYGEAVVGFAVMPIHRYRVLEETKTILTEGTWYCIDRDGDHDLSDEMPVLFREGGDCSVAGCRAVDSIERDIGWCTYDLEVRRPKGKSPLVSYRRADAIKGLLMVDSIRYPVLLWDRRCMGYGDLSSIVLAVDRNGDGVFDTREGSVELYEHCRGRITFDSSSIRIDTITPDGLRLFCSDFQHTGETPSAAVVGGWTDNFTAAASCPLSLYQECAANRYVLLCFFEGVAQQTMSAPELSLLLTLMREQLGSTRLIGINRRSIGALYTEEPVINENRGWDGPLVRQFHNHRDWEIICLDAEGTIVYRGEIGPSAVTGIWNHAQVDDLVALAVYEQRLTGQVVDGVAR